MGQWPVLWDLSVALHGLRRRTKKAPKFSLKHHPSPAATWAGGKEVAWGEMMKVLQEERAGQAELLVWSSGQKTGWGSVGLHGEMQHRT